MRQDSFVLHFKLFAKGSSGHYATCLQLNNADADSDSSFKIIMIFLKENTYLFHFQKIFHTLL